MIKWLKKRKSRSKKNFDLHKRGVAAFFILYTYFMWCPEDAPEQDAGLFQYPYPDDTFA